MNILRISLLSFMIMIPSFCVGALEYGRAQVGFAEKVNAYVQRVRSGSSGKEGVGEVLGRANLLTPYSSMKSVVTILNRLGAFLIKDKDAATNEACCASLVKVVVPIVEQFDRELFENLYTIDRCLEYWEYQRMNPVSYFFHKSPLKYFTLGQEEEVADKIQFLKAEQQYQLALLGKISIHLSSFDADRSIDNQYDWIQQLCRILFSYDATSSIAPDAELFPLLYESTNLVENYRIFMSDLLSSYHVPSVIMRRWLEGIALVAGVTYATSKNWDDIKGYSNQVVNDISERLEARADVVSAEGSRDMLDLAQDREAARAFGISVKKYAKLRAGLAEYWVDIKQCKQPTGGGSRAGDGRYVIADLRKNPIEIAYDFYRTIILNASGGSPRLRKIKDDLKDAGPSFGRARDMNSFFRQVIRDALNDTPQVDFNNANESGWMNAFLGRITGAPQAWSRTKNMLGTFKVSSHLWMQEYPKLWSLIKASPWVLASGIAALSVHKLYKKIRGVPNYDPLRADLVDMALLLNVYGDSHPADMDACDFGKLVYLAHKLQQEEGRVPKQHRFSFMNEVGLLQRSSLTADQKMKVIDLMYKKYPFLAQQAVPGA